MDKDQSRWACNTTTVQFPSRPSVPYPVRVPRLFPSTHPTAPVHSHLVHINGSVPRPVRALVFSLSSGTEVRFGKWLPLRGCESPKNKSSTRSSVRNRKGSRPRIPATRRLGPKLVVSGNHSVFVYSYTYPYRFLSTRTNVTPLRNDP